MSRKPEDYGSLHDMPYAEQVDLICDQFERDWKANRKPDAREYSELAAPLYRDRVLRELILTERECVLFVKVPSTSPQEPSTSDTQPEYLDSWKSETKVESPSGKQQRDRSIPSHIDRYLIRKVLGEGSHGIVYEAEDVEIRKCVALKVNKNLGTMNRSLEREASIASRIEHPAIVSVLNCGQFGDYSYLVTEMVRGANLKHFANGLALDPRVASEIMIQIANAIHAAHQSGVIHRDLKPSNIMVVSASRTDEPSTEKHLLSSDQNDNSKIEKLSIRILDFGVARSDDRLTVTNEGSIIGTPHYMSPEQASGNTSKISARSDIFSMGIIFYELLTGDVPFNGQTMVVLRAISEVQVPSVGLAKPDLPSGLVEIVDKCLCLDPSQRYLSAKQLEDDLHAWINGAPSTSTRPLILNNSFAWTTAVSILCLAIIGIVLVYSGTRKPEPISANRHENEANALLAGWVNDGDPDQFAKWLEFDGPKSLPAFEHVEPGDSWRLELAKLGESGSKLGIEAMNVDALYENIAENSQKNWEPILAKCDDGLLMHLARKVCSDRRFRNRRVVVESFSKQLLSRTSTELFMSLLSEVPSEDLGGVVASVEPSDELVMKEILIQFKQFEDILSGKLEFKSNKEIRFCGRLGLVAYKLRRTDIVESILSFSNDPRARTSFIAEFAESQLPTTLFVDHLANQKNDWIASAMAECVIRAKTQGKDLKKEEDYIKFLEEAFISHPSASVHWMAMIALKSCERFEFIDKWNSNPDWQNIKEDRNWFLINGIPMSIIRCPMHFYFGLKDDRMSSNVHSRTIENSFAISAFSLTSSDISQVSLITDSAEDPRIKIEDARMFCEKLKSHSTSGDLNLKVASVWEWECSHRAGTKTEYWADLCPFGSPLEYEFNPLGICTKSNDLFGELCNTTDDGIKADNDEVRTGFQVYKGGSSPVRGDPRSLAMNSLSDPNRANRYAFRVVATGGPLHTN